MEKERVRIRMRGRAPGAFPVRRDEQGTAAYEAALAGVGWYRVSGAPIRETRFRLGLTQGALAAELRTGQVYVSYMENDQGFVTLPGADRLAAVLNRLAGEAGLPTPGFTGRDLLSDRHRPEAEDATAVYPAAARSA